MLRALGLRRNLVAQGKGSVATELSRGILWQVKGPAVVSQNCATILVSNLGSSGKQSLPPGSSPVSQAKQLCRAEYNQALGFVTLWYARGDNILLNGVGTFGFVAH